MKVNPQELEMTFKTYAKGGSVSSRDFNKVVRACGLNPTEASCADLKRKCGGGNCDFDTFKAVLIPELEKARDTLDEIVDSFSVFDQDGNGKISVSEFRHVMTGMGEALSEQEMMDVMEEVEKEGGMIDYREFATMIFGEDEG
jgi:calmodulin